MARFYQDGPARPEPRTPRTVLSNVDDEQTIEGDR
jgi:hypothetical protein